MLKNLFNFRLICSEDQGARVEAEEQDWAIGSVEGSEGGIGVATRGEGHRRRSEQVVEDQGREALDCSGSHRDFSEAEIGSEGSVQEQEVLASRSPP